MKRSHWRWALGGIVVGALLSAGPVPAADPPKTADDIIPNTTVKFTMIQLPAGKITIKDKDGKEVEVAIKPIWMGKTEVTWDEYDNFWQCFDLPVTDREAAVKNKSRPSAPYEPPDRGWGHEGSPAGSMFCREAKRYCEWLSKKTGKKYRLPTEAEWEYACRAGGPPVKLDKADLKKVAWFDANADDTTHPCAKKDPNAWGFYDMLGNVAEWVIRTDGGEAVAGGSFLDPAEDIGSAARAAYDRSWQKHDPQIPKGQSWLSDGGHVGFRIVRED